ncbi:MAG: hypothetical protein ACKO19_00965 [Betaproteobacteria bacterium]
MKPDNEAVTNRLTAKLPLSKADFMAKWNKLSPRAQRELLDLAKERDEEGLDEAQTKTSEPTK